MTTLDDSHVEQPDTPAIDSKPVTATAAPKAEDKPKVADLWNHASALPTDIAARQLVVDAWKQTVSVQMHFNDICMKIRNLAITMLAAAIGLAAYSTKERMELDVLGNPIPIGTFIALGASVGWIAFWAMDRHWYHAFLRAASTHAGRIEERWKGVLPELLLSSEIAEASNRTWFNSRRRLNIFYVLGMMLLLFSAWAVWFTHPANTLTVSQSEPIATVTAPAPKAAIPRAMPQPAETTPGPRNVPATASSTVDATRPPQIVSRPHAPTPKSQTSPSTTAAGSQ